MDKDKDKKEDINSEKTNEISVFHNNSTLSFIHKKAEKISCAIYLLTNHLSDQEPLKWDIRGLSLEFIKDIFLLRNNFSDDFLIFENLKCRISEMLSFVDLLMSIGFISEMNYRVLRTEIVDLSKFLEPKYDFSNSPDTNFSDDFFNITQSLPRERQSKSEDIYLERSEQNMAKYLLDEEKLLKDISKGQDKGHSFKGHMSFKEMSFNNTQKGSGKNLLQSSSSKRKQDIIAFIKDKKEVTVKDITRLIKDCSEKTLQRDLISLVKAGVLKKKGERRWSKYLLA